MGKNPNDRFATAVALRDELLSYMGERGRPDPGAVSVLSPDSLPEPPPLEPAAGQTPTLEAPTAPPQSSQKTLLVEAPAPRPKWMLTLTAVVSVAVIAIMAVFVRMLLTPPWPADFPQTDFVWIAPGEFTMGSPDTEAGREPDETQYRVTLSSGYWLAKYEVTQEQWQAVMGANPAIFATLRDPKLPIENVSWDEVQLFIKKLNAAEGTDFRLPTEAEWEYGCRAGTSAAFSFGEGNARLGECAWYKENGQTLTHPVGTKQPNALGLYDMHGNVKEWCQDWAGPYPVGPATDPQGPETGTARIYRGGSWGTDGATCRSADRSFLAPTKQGSDLGFRLCR